MNGWLNNIDRIGDKAGQDMRRKATVAMCNQTTIIIIIIKSSVCMEGGIVCLHSFFFTIFYGNVLNCTDRNLM